MCESTVWLRHPDGRTEKIVNNVLFAKQDGKWVVLRGPLAEPRRVLGTIQEIDSFKHTITVLATESSDVSAQSQDER